MVNIISEPAGQIALSEPLRWELELGAAPPAGITKKIGYQLICVDDGSEVTPVEAVDAEGIVALTFNQVIEGLVETGYYVPAAGVNNMPSFKKQFKLKYGEITTDEETCETTVAIDQETDPVWVLNSFGSYVDALDFTASGLILSDRPLTYCACPDAGDSIIVVGSGTVDFMWSGQSNGTTGIALPFNANAVPLSPSALGLTGVDKLEAAITVGGNTTTYRIGFGDCGCDGFAVDLHWLEPLGSWSTQKFKVENAESSSEFLSACLGDKYAKNLTTPGGENYTMYGASKVMRNVRPQKSFTLYREFDNVEEVHMWLLSLGAAREMFIKVKNRQGKVNVRFTPTGGVQTYKEDGFIRASITGKI